MAEAQVDIRSFQPADWPQVRTLIGDHLEAHHPILREELFFWQYRGFGPHADHRPFKLLFVDGELKGLRGGFGVLLQVPQQDGTVRVTPGCSMAMWLLAPDLRGQGLGFALLQAVQEESPVVIGLGSNKISVPIYRRNGWSSLDALHQWFRPLDAGGFLELSFGPWDPDEVRAWSADLPAVAPVAPAPADPTALEVLWKETAGSAALFGVHRTAAFWQWRYVEHPEFDYLFFGDAAGDGVVVGRIERCWPTGRDGEERLALRILEIVPRRLGTWHGEADPAMTALLAGALTWAREQGCVAADHRNSTLRHRHVLVDAGFAEHREEEPDARGRGFAGVLHPFRPRPEPINAHWIITAEPGDRTDFPVDDVYLVKSDGDLDRPNDRPSLEAT